MGDIKMAKVTVGLKLAGNLVITLGSGKELQEVELNGFSKNQFLVSDAHGITEGVDKEFWDKWREANKETKLVKGGFIFAHESNASTKAEAKEKAKVKSGTEKLNPKEQAGIETAPKQG